MQARVQASKWTVFVIVSACSVIAVGAGSAEAKRQPTFKEREAITAALPAWLRGYPVGCVWLGISVSSNPRYARVGLGFLNATRPPCSKYTSNGFWILKKLTKWRIIYNGSTQPSCSLRIPRDLTPCLR